ncbi:MAG TPA: hypothetical protein VND22_04880 [Actinomycetota bacterium]|nr:hypothetical protein [Actinomycetota bacterium]
MLVRMFSPVAKRGTNAFHGLALAVITVSFLACGNDPPQRPLPSSKPTPTLVSEDQVWKQEPGATGTWIAAFFLPENGDSCGVGLTPERRWNQISTEGSIPTGEEGLRIAYRTLFGAKAVGLSNPLERVPLDLLSAQERDGTHYLDFSHWIQQTSRFGTCGAAAMGGPFFATFRHYYPEARRLCITLEGKAPDEGHGSIFHDSVACPYWEESST